MDTGTVKDLTASITLLGGLIVAILALGMSGLAAIQIANARRARALQPINQATTDEQLKYLGEKTAPIIGGWSSTLNELKQATTQIEQLRRELNESRGVRADLQTQATANRVAQTALEEANDVLRKRVRTMEDENADLKRNIDELTRDKAAKELEMSNLREDLRLAREETVGLREDLKSARLEIQMLTTRLMPFLEGQSKLPLPPEGATADVVVASIQETT